MTCKIKKYALLIVGGLMYSTITWASEGSLSMLVGNCESCHGPKGSSLGPATPTIADIDEETFLEAMEAYRNDERPSTIMGRIAKGYTEQDFKIMADYFGKQSFVRQVQEVDAEKVKKGRKLHNKYCEKCHEEGGFIDEDGSSILAGQWMPYLQFALMDFQSGSRDMPKKMKKRMQKMMKAHGETSLEDIVHFYGSQIQSEVKRDKHEDDHDHDND